MSQALLHNTKPHRTKIHQQSASFQQTPHEIYPLPRDTRPTVTREQQQAPRTRKEPQDKDDTHKSDYRTTVQNIVVEARFRRFFKLSQSRDHRCHQCSVCPVRRRSRGWCSVELWLVARGRSQHAEVTLTTDFIATSQLVYWPLFLEPLQTYFTISRCVSFY